MEMEVPEIRELNPAPEYTPGVAVLEKLSVFRSELDTLPEYENLRQHPNLLRLVSGLHPGIQLNDRLVVLSRLGEMVQEDSGTRDLITPAIIRLLDDGDPLYPRQVTMEAVERLKITDALPKLKVVFKNSEPVVRAHAMHTFSIFPYEQVADVLEEGLNDSTRDNPNNDVVAATLYTMRGMDLPPEVIDRVWQRFETRDNLYKKVYEEGTLLAIKDPERMSRRLAEIVDESFRIVGSRELRYSMLAKWVPRAAFNMTNEELAQKTEAKERRDKMLRLAKDCVNNLENKEPFVKKLNEWLEITDDAEEINSILNALTGTANLDTVHLIARKNPMQDNLIYALVLISWSWSRFKDDDALNEYLDRLPQQQGKKIDLTHAIAAIKEGKRLKIVSPPYSIGLAIDE